MTVILSGPNQIGHTSQIPIYRWIGISGSPYVYSVYDLSTEFVSKPGNYIFVRLEHNCWVPVYIGETGNLSERFDDHHKMPCIKRKGATHIHVHISSDSPEVRRYEERDILLGNQSAYEPYGCNGR